MVHQGGLDRVFSAVADPTRREVLTRLGQGAASVGELAEPFGMSVTGMAKHVRVLEEAGLVVSEKVGRARMCRLGEERLEGAMAWISFYQRLWERRLDGLEAYFTLQRGTDECPPTPPSSCARPACCPPPRSRCSTPTPTPRSRRSGSRSSTRGPASGRSRSPGASAGRSQPSGGPTATACSGRPRRSS